MRNLFTQHRAALVLTVMRMLDAPLATLLTVFVIGIALSLPLGLYLLVDNLGQIAANSQGQPEISIFLKDNAGSAVRRNLEAKLDERAEVKEYRFVPRDEALHELSKNMGLSDAAAILGKNPLPDAFVVTAQDADPDKLDQLRQDMQAWPGVHSAKLDSEWARRLNAFLRLGQQAVWLLAALLGFALAAVGFNTIRLQILTKRDEIEISKLIGATDSFIRRPFLYFGAIQGLAGGATAWLIIALVIHAMNEELITLAQLYDFDLQLQHLSPADSTSLLLFSAWLGWLGARISVASHLWQIEPK